MTQKTMGEMVVAQIIAKLERQIKRQEKALEESKAHLDLLKKK